MNWNAIKTGLNTNLQLITQEATDVQRTEDTYRQRYADKYKPEALAEKINQMRAAAVANHVDGYNESIAIVRETLANADQWSREAVMRRSKLVSDTALSDTVSSDTRAIVAALTRSEESNTRTRIMLELQHASDKDLSGRYALDAVRQNNPAYAGLVLDEAQRRGGEPAMRVRLEVEKIPMPEVEEVEAALQAIDTLQRDLKSAFHTLQTGTGDTRARMQSAVKANQDAA